MNNHLQMVVFLHRQVHSGGQRYLFEVFSYLQGHGVKVIPIYLDDFPKWVRRLGLFLDCLIYNFWLFKQVHNIASLNKVIFFEDVYLRPRLFLFNILIRLLTGRLKTVVLAQNVLTNHRLRKNCILRKLDDILAWLFFQQASLVFTNSEFIRQRVLLRGVTPDKTRMVYCGFKSLYDESIEIAGEPKQDDSSQRILFIGQCEPYKGVDVLLRAVAQLDQSKKYSFTIDIVGDTATNAAYYQQLLDIVERENLGECVQFWGHVGNKGHLRRFYEQAGIFVLPSRCEGFGITLLEAMSFGLPIVATKAGAIPELVRDGVNGLLVPPNDAQALAEAMERLLNASDLRAEYGRTGWRYCHDNQKFYSWKSVGERILNSLHEIGL